MRSLVSLTLIICEIFPSSHCDVGSELGDIYVFSDLM